MGKRRLSVGVVLTVMGMTLILALPQAVNAQKKLQSCYKAIKGLDNAQGRIERNVIRDIPKPSINVKPPVVKQPKVSEIKVPVPDVKKYERKQFPLKSNVSSLDSIMKKRAAADSLKAK